MMEISSWPKIQLGALARHRFTQLKKARKKFEKIQRWYKNQILHEGYVETTVGGLGPSHKLLFCLRSRVKLVGLVDSTSAYAAAIVTRECTNCRLVIYTRDWESDAKEG